MHSGKTENSCESPFGVGSVSETLAANSISTPESREKNEIVRKVSKRRRFTSPEIRRDPAIGQEKQLFSSKEEDRGAEEEISSRAGEKTASTLAATAPPRPPPSTNIVFSRKDESRVRRCTNVHFVTLAGATFEIDERYIPIKVIGHGAYGIVIACKDNVSGGKVAIKKIPGAFSDVIEAKRVLREIKLLLAFDHDNLMCAMEVFRPPSQSKCQDIYIVSALMETDLHRIIYSKQDLTDDHTQYFTYQILRALKYMHSAQVLHRDLKPSNVLLNSNCDLKICDFGLARGIHEESDLTEYVVTRWYRAPEIMLSCQQYSKAVDVWSVGCILAELIARKPLFPGDDYIHQLQLITQKIGTPASEDMAFIRSDRARRFMAHLPLCPKTRWSDLFRGVNAQALDLLDKMLVFNPAKRITVQEALKHPYLESLHCDEDEPVADFKFDFTFDATISSADEARESIFENSGSSESAGELPSPK